MEARSGCDMQRFYTKRIRFIKWFGWVVSNLKFDTAYRGFFQLGVSRVLFCVLKMQDCFLLPFWNELFGVLLWLMHGLRLTVWTGMFSVLQWLVHGPRLTVGGGCSVFYSDYCTALDWLSGDAQGFTTTSVRPSLSGRVQCFTMTGARA